MKGYPGNKSLTSLYPNIINEFPVHSVYWELFAGSAQILKKKKPASINVAVELSKAQAVGSNYPPGTVVINSCAISLLDDLQNVGPEHLVYLDPPYIISSRSSQRRIYEHELSDLDHVSLLSKLVTLRCRVAISHYPCSIYDDMLKGWRRKEIKVSYRGRVRSEAVYFNYPAGLPLHETTFTGQNKTHRQMIKRKAERWVKRFQELPTQEKQAVIEILTRAGVVNNDCQRSTVVKNNCQIPSSQK